MARNRRMAQYPMRAVVGAACGARIVIEEDSRLVDEPAVPEETIENVLAPHRARTLQRMRGQSTVLCVQDGASLDLERHDRAGGLSDVPSNRTGATTRGLYLHANVAMGADGLPLGVLWADFDAPRPDGDGNEAREEKESFRGIEGLRDCARAARELPGTRIVFATDRGADFLDLFVERRERAPQVELLVRAKVDPAPGKDAPPEGSGLARRLFDAVRDVPARDACAVDVPRPGRAHRGRQSGSKARAGRARRQGDTTLSARDAAVSRNGAGRDVAGARP